MKYPQSKILTMLASRYFTVTVLVLIFLVGAAFYRDHQNQQDIDQELNVLEQEIGELQGKRVELTRLVDILESSDYIEREARLRLGLKKRGEKVISVPDNARPQPAVLGASTDIESQQPPYKQWIEYFFLTRQEADKTKE